MEQIKQKYTDLCKIPSDINEHLPTLFKYALECDTILELGVRGCISSYAFTYGLINDQAKNKNLNNKHLILNDINNCNIAELLNYCNQLDNKIDIKYFWMNDLDLQLNHNVDLTFIDTWHVYGQLKRELDKFSKITNKYIIMHDTTLDGIYGETIRSNWNAKSQSITTGIPENEITKGLQPAIDEFLQSNTHWKILEVFTNNNGLTILQNQQL